MTPIQKWATTDSLRNQLYKPITSKETKGNAN